MKSAWVSDDVMSHILAALTKENRLAVLVSLTTGLRISDVLGLRTDQLRKKFTITEQKTLKRKLVTLSDKLLNELIAIAGPVFVFEHRCDPRRHRTRQYRVRRVTLKDSSYTCYGTYSLRSNKRRIAKSRRRVRKICNRRNRTCNRRRTQ